MDQSMYPVFAEQEDRHWWFTGRRAIFRRALERTVVGSGAVLDVGCGTGGNFPLLNRFGPVTGLDVDADAVRYAQHRPYDRVVQTDARALPFEDGSFQLVSAIDLLEHVEDDRALVAELTRVLRPGGYLFLSTAAMPFLWSRHDDLNCHVRRYTRRSFSDTIANNALEPPLIRFYNVLLFAPIAIARLVERAFPRTAARAGDLRELRTPPQPLNAMLQKILSTEQHLLRLPLPFGVSLLSVSQKKR